MHTRKLSPEELAQRLPGMLAKARRDLQARRHAEVMRDKAAAEAMARAASRAAARNQLEAARAFLAAQDSPVVGPSLREKLLKASQRGLRIQGPGGRYLSVKKAAG